MKLNVMHATNNTQIMSIHNAKDAPQAIVRNQAEEWTFWNLYILEIYRILLISGGKCKCVEN